MFDLIGIKQIDFALACVCTVINHRRHSVEKTKSHGTRLRLVSYFFVLSIPRHDVICDPLQYTRTLKRNLFGKYCMLQLTILRFLCCCTIFRRCQHILFFLIIILTFSRRTTARHTATTRC